LDDSAAGAAYEGDLPRAAFEAIIGLAIEIMLIATFT
jgi:hypothetical protein